MANSHPVHGVLGYLMSTIGTRQRIVWAGELRGVGDIDPNFMSQQCGDSIQYMTGVFTRCGCFQGCLKIQKMRQWWKSMAPRHCIPRWRVRCMPSRLMIKSLDRMRHTGWSKLQSPGRAGGCQNRSLRMANHFFGYQRRMHTLLIMNGPRKSKLNYRPLWNDTLQKVLQEHGGYIDGVWHVSHWYWETPKIRMTFQNNGTMNGHPRLG